ncbi:hypothetical protein [Methylobacter sp. YRD-M1]|uniref:hypothetical protein n=1 Tax=Methylobacter sp. YRD-M1 TaxID=2911520 RepID=UPI00227D01C8|nr:hypothetical protein [Methylobacter sp. YRD-M1]WAK01497.1 hypothetical protein LZ558_16960 [Methylobacter sp. YRD-M1]
MSTKARIVEISDFSIFNVYFMPNGFPYFPFSLIAVADSRAFATASGCFFHFAGRVFSIKIAQNEMAAAVRYFYPPDLQSDSDACTKRYASRMIS